PPSGTRRRRRCPGRGHRGPARATGSGRTARPSRHLLLGDSILHGWSAAPPGRTGTVGATGADAVGAVLASRVRGRRGARLSPTAPAAAPSAAGPCDRTSGAGRSRGP